MKYFSKPVNNSIIVSCIVVYEIENLFINRYVKSYTPICYFVEDIPMFPTERTGISKFYFFYQPLPCIYSNKRYLKNDLKIVTSSVCDNITNKLECIVQYI